MEQDSFNFLCFIIFITNTIWMIWNIFLHRNLDKLKEGCKNNYADLNSLNINLHLLKSELRYIYRKSKIIPYKEKKRLDEFFESEDYEVYPPEGWN